MGKRVDEVRDELIAIRATPGDKALIRKRATAAGFASMSEYMIRCALGTLDRSELEKRFDQFVDDTDRRLELLETAANLGGFG